MARSPRKRKRYTEAQRTKVLETATREGLTAADVEKKFGVAPVTYYSWRKKTGITRRRGSSALVAMAAGGADLTSHVRDEVAARIRQVLPNIVRSEVSQYLTTLFSRSPGHRRARRSK